MPRGSAEARGNRVKNPIDENFITLPCALPLWAEFCDAALSHERLLVVAAGFHHRQRRPGEYDLTLIERATQVARIAIERDVVRRALYLRPPSSRSSRR